jgi:glucose-6-phosphate 1-dehydrogenase
VLGGKGEVIATLRDGDCFGEVAILLSEPRIATVRAKTVCDLFVLERSEFSRVLRDHQQFAATIKEIARERYNRAVPAEQLLAPG